MRSSLVAVLFLAYSGSAFAETYTYMSALCISENKIVRVAGPACLDRANANVGFLDEAGKLGRLCLSTLTDFRENHFGTTRKPTKANGCEPDMP